MRPHTLLTALAMLAVLSTAPSALAATVFSTDFETGWPPEFSAPGSVITSVQSYAGLGPPERQFGGLFLRYTSVPIHPTTLTLRNLPPHDHLSVKFLLALIDSWDGTELMQISVDGALKFNNWFQLALGDSSNYYPPPPGALLSHGTDLGFSGCCYYNRDRAYDLGVEPAFLDIPHTADTVQVVWTIGAVSGPAAAQWQGGDDESWAIDAVSVEVSTQNVGVPDDLAGGRLALAAHPNPARGSSVHLDFTLLAGKPGRLELLDVAGRQVASRVLDGFGAGRHSIALTADRPLLAGVYFARLTQAGGVCAVRVAVID